MQFKQNLKFCRCEMTNINGFFKIYYIHQQEIERIFVTIEFHTMSLFRTETLCEMLLCLQFT